MPRTTIRAKFYCNYVTDFGPHGGKKVNMTAVYSSEDENASFSKATPSGTFELSVSSGTLAESEFKPGELYYFDIHRVPKPAPAVEALPAYQAEPEPATD